ncbi:hypothetical protein [Pontibacter sp. G13]|uniref:hypothetical protein n=1 Tax=Pontibacter sp. G13 TaxID=3074898 RepID=UPI002889C574|nr:hypothetical protein [Pontibacter sp. G13]WNJ19198.1 hypothetical protein RJD25_01795 [Pontibacter sp. G13]
MNLRFSPLFFLVLLFCGKASAQEVVAVSDSITLDFGYPALVILEDLTFFDDNEDNELNPGEGAVISFTIQNQGEYPAKGVVVKPKELNDLPGLVLPSIVRVGNILPGKKRKVQVVVEGDEDLAEGTINIAFVVWENDQNQQLSIVYALSASQ